MPDKGVNAVEQTALFAQSITKWLHKKGKYPLLGHSTCTITNLHGGVHSNVVPEYAKASFDIRTSPCIDHNSVLEKIQAIAQDQMRENVPLKISYDVTQNRPALGMDENAPLVRTFAEIYKKLKIPWKTTGIKYFTDASIFVPRLGVPFVIIGPGEEIFFHQSNEYIVIESVLRIAQILKEYLLKATRQKGGGK
jgi:succinyl-diaminopimelate desuccinylase